MKIAFSYKCHLPFWEKGRKFPWFLTSQSSSFLARPTSDVDSRANMGGRVIDGA